MTDCPNAVIQQIKDARLVPTYVALNILMTGICICWFHQIACAMCFFAAFVMNAGKEKPTVLQSSC